MVVLGCLVAVGSLNCRVQCNRWNGDTKGFVLRNRISKCREMLGTSPYSRILTEGVFLSG